MSEEKVMTESDEIKISQDDADDTKDAETAADTDPAVTESKADGEAGAEASDSETGSEEDAKSDESSSDESESSDKAKEDNASADSDDDKDSGNERYMRLMAEFQNYKKRVAKEKSDIREYATEKLIVELLPVLDNFERALASSAEDDPAAYAKGMEMIFTQMKTELQKSGLKELDVLGEEFDPKLHNAVMTEEHEEIESGKVSKVLQKGYALNDKVIRPAMVAVAK